MDHSQNLHIESYWQAFLNTFPPESEAVPDQYQAWGFGNTPEMADELGDLVVRGIKTATAALLWDFEEGGESFPRVGDHSIILDGAGVPLCIIRATEISEVPFNMVGEEQAHLEGEGDRSLRYWREVHWKFFAEECEKLNREPDEQMPVVCEKFVLVYV